MSMPSPPSIEKTAKSLSTNSDLAAEIQRKLAGAYNYYLWIYKEFEADLGQNLLEIGCGGGHFTRLIMQQPCSLVVADIEEQYLTDLQQQYATNPKFSTTTIDLNAVNWSATHKEQYDTVVLLNVLEHIENDEHVLTEIWQTLKPAGKLILMVPAFQSIYGAMDAADHHYRRYARKEVVTKLTRANFKIEWLRYMNRLGFFAWFFNGRILRRSLLPEGQLGFYNQIIPFIRHLEHLLPLPFGQSIISVASRPS